jgi:DeoR/GlpR family transcriptional regulator of sugar metabolism
MLKEERLKYIMHQVNLHNKVLSVDISRELNVSDDTIRRDLKELEKEGKILKVHGGALSPSLHFSLTGSKPVYAVEAKRQIAMKAKSLFKNDIAILMEGGTTILELARSIPENLRASAFTLSPQIAITLSEHTRLDVVTIGGKLSKNAYIHTGASVINQLSEIKTDLCIIGANGLSVAEGLTDSDWEIVQVIKAMVRSSKQVAVLCIAEKLNTSQKMKICDLNSIDFLITEAAPDDPILEPYRNADITVL